MSESAETAPPTVFPASQPQLGFGPGPGLLWLMRLLVVAAAGVTGYLLAVTWIQGSLPAGCGSGSGCAAVLSSRWASVLGFPVSAPALALDLSLLLLLCLPPGRSDRSRAWLFGLRLLLAATVAWSAVWFLGVQLALVGKLCVWCVTAHGIGLVVALLVLCSTPVRWMGTKAIPAASNLWFEPAGRLTGITVLGVAMLALFSVGLLAVAQTLVEPPVVVGRLPAGQNADTGPGPDRRLAVLNGKLAVSPHQEPVLGSPDAPHVVLVMFDYCCPHCRAMHAHLIEAQIRHPGKIALLLLPTPLDKSCNPHVEETEPRFRNACELARHALAVWETNPAVFSEYDQWLFESEFPRSTEEARTKAVGLITGAALDRALAKPGIAAAIRRNVEAYNASGAERIPVLLSPGLQGIVGRVNDEQELLGILEKELQLSQPKP